MKRNEFEKLLADERAVFCAAFAAAYVLYTRDGSYESRAKWRAGIEAKAAVKAFNEELKP